MAQCSSSRHDFIGGRPQISAHRTVVSHLFLRIAHWPDDGTLAPWALVASLPFAPEIILPALEYCIHQAQLKKFNHYGFKASFNPTTLANRRPE
jgi:hypothetical protein